MCFTYIVKIYYIHLVYSLRFDNKITRNSFNKFVLTDYQNYFEVEILF
jgi:hypothetical protein